MNVFLCIMSHHCGSGNIGISSDLVCFPVSTSRSFFVLSNFYLPGNADKTCFSEGCFPTGRGDAESYCSVLSLADKFQAPMVDYEQTT